MGAGLGTGTGGWVLDWVLGLGDGCWTGYRVWLSQYHELPAGPARRLCNAV